MKSKLLIISDIFGFEDCSWIDNYVELLDSDFQLTLYDSCKLTKINRSGLSENELHSQFVNGGISNAVSKLVRLETKEVNVLSFSIGGTIAWKSALNGVTIDNLYAVSSTRLRYETEKPNCSLRLIYGEKDLFKPNSDWFAKMNLECETIKDGGHEFYKEKEFIKNLCCRIKHSH